MDWLRNQYNDIKGNLKWAIILWLLGGGGLTVLAHWLQAASHLNVAGWLALAAPIFSILAVLYLLMILQPKITATSPDQIEDLSPATIQSLQAPKSVDLRGEVLEIYFYSPDQTLPGQGHFLTISPDIGQAYVLIQALIVNHGPDPATIKAAALEIILGSFRHNAELIEIPTQWRLKKKKEGAFFGFGYTWEETTIEPQLGASGLDTETYVKGIPRRGWLGFKFYNFGHLEFPNAEFILHLEDSLGGLHRICREPMAYDRIGEIVVASPPPTPAKRIISNP